MICCLRTANARNLASPSSPDALAAILKQTINKQENVFINNELAAADAAFDVDEVDDIDESSLLLSLVAPSLPVSFVSLRGVGGAACGTGALAADNVVLYFRHKIIEYRETYQDEVVLW